MKKLIFLAVMILSSQFITAQFDFDPDGNVQIANSTSNVIRVQVGFNDGTDCVLDVWKTVCVAPWSSSIVGVPGKFPFTARAWTADSTCTPDMPTLSVGFNPILVPGCPGIPLVSPYEMNWNYFMGTWGITVFI